MLRICMEPRSVQYHDILEYFAESIVALVRDPLPPLPAMLDIESMRNAFWEPPEEDKVDRALAAVAVPDQVMVTSPAQGPSRMLVIELRHANGTTDWAPYTGESIPALFEQIANQEHLATDWLTLDPSAKDFMDRILSELSDAADRSIRAMVVADPLSLTNNISTQNLMELLKQPCRAGLLLPADATNRTQITLIDQFCALLKREGYHPNWIVRDSIGNEAQFRTAASSVLHDVRARIVDTDGPCRSPPKNDGPTTLPRIANR
jgi:hypothetical protein